MILFKLKIPVTPSNISVVFWLGVKRSLSAVSRCFL